MNSFTCAEWRKWVSDILCTTAKKPQWYQSRECFPRTSFDLLFSMKFLTFRDVTPLRRHSFPHCGHPVHGLNCLRFLSTITQLNPKVSYFRYSFFFFLSFFSSYPKSTTANREEKKKARKKVLVPFSNPMEKSTSIHEIANKLNSSKPLKVWLCKSLIQDILSYTLKVTYYKLSLIWFSSPFQKEEYNNDRNRCKVLHAQQIFPTRIVKSK